MTGPLPVEVLIQASLKGVARAQQEYEALSGEWLWRAPEYYSSTCIAQEILKLPHAKYLTMENGTKSAITEAGSRGRGRLHSSIRGRFDMLLWWADGTPRAPIEVKRHVLNFKTIEKDALRIEKVLNRGNNENSIRFGAIVFYTSARPGKKTTAKEKIENAFTRIEGDAKNLLGDSCNIRLHPSPVETVEDSAWAGAVLLIKPL
ncbi:MAG: hypothetical protein J0H59_18200 [Comamonadaceae bacterium]|nr:hypothetical protein [Comamonadaceae bacterium]